MNRRLQVLDRQKHHAVRAAALRQLLRHLIAHELKLPACDLSIVLIDAEESARVNLGFLAHEGPTDVITFDYGSSPSQLRGEILVCPEVAARQGKRFRQSLGSELVRYSVHGILHLCGYDDLAAADRRRMKKQENLLVRRLQAHASFCALTGRPKRASGNQPRATRSRSRTNV